MLVVLSLPHIVVWTSGPGIGSDLVASLASHPIEVSEVRSIIEAERVAAGRLPRMVVLVCPRNASQTIAKAKSVFPGIHVLLITNSTGHLSPTNVGVSEVPSDESIEQLCWDVFEALTHTEKNPAESWRHLGPMLFDLDQKGIVCTGAELDTLSLVHGIVLNSGESIVSLLSPEDSEAFTRHMQTVEMGGVCFFPVRMRNSTGSVHLMNVGMRFAGPDRISLILQPMIDSAAVVGRRRGARDPITGLIDRWELWREMLEGNDLSGEPSCVVFAKLDAFESIATSMTFREVDDVFDRVASAISRAFPWPASPSRLTGGAFLILIKGSTIERVKRRTEHLIRMVNRIGGQGVFEKFRYGLSVGICEANNGDYDLAVRLAEAAVREARAEGGNQAIVAGPDTSRLARVRELLENMEERSWDLWLQPVVSHVDGLPKFHEALARFGQVNRPKISRPEFFTTGELDGILQRFDRMVLVRSLEMLVARPQLRLSVNVTKESFCEDSFPRELLGLVRESAVSISRLIIEISPACLSLAPSLVKPRMQELAETGVAIALDDFGSGVCCIRHLTDYQIAIVKLDELVTSYVADDPLQRNFVRMVVNLCRARGMLVVAEFTRTLDQMERLAADGVDLFQGELVGMPRSQPLFKAPPGPQTTDALA